MRAKTKYVIYKIYWPKQNVFYIGKTKGFRKRRNRHLREMKDGTHHNARLILFYKRYGEPKIRIIDFAVCDETLAEKERGYLEKYREHVKCCNLYHK